MEITKILKFGRPIYYQFDYLKIIIIPISLVFSETHMLHIKVDFEINE
jgi:hypothetical protein